MVTFSYGRWSFLGPLQISGVLICSAILYSVIPKVFSLKA